MNKDLGYFIRRESREREQAADSNDIAVRIAHLAAADGYAARIVKMRVPAVASRD